jgi:2-C-methyl-D-erythritol 2,4-cyclodiphosphate synthase
LILGGLHIEFELGLDGHSDADVLTHAIINALLGAAGLGDIGRYFPPTDPTYKGIPSLKMLAEVALLVQERGWQIQNIDATVAAQRPKLSPHVAAMRQNLADCLNIDLEQVNVKATTTEKLGFVGREEGLEAHAVALLSR